MKDANYFPLFGFVNIFEHCKHQSPISGHVKYDSFFSICNKQFYELTERSLITLFFYQEENKSVEVKNAWKFISHYQSEALRNLLFSPFWSYQQYAKSHPKCLSASVYSICSVHKTPADKNEICMLALILTTVYPTSWLRMTIHVQPYVWNMLNRVIPIVIMPIADSSNDALHALISLSGHRHQWLYSGFQSTLTLVYWMIMGLQYTPLHTTWDSG